MASLFIGYILPFLCLGLLLTAVALRIHWRGGPAALAVIFFIVLFGPSLVYAIIADDSSGALFGFSLITALAVVGIMYFKLYRQK
jgi:4-amino-4-deoxy-L-arabinose transferase-like glycosyltransferase